METTRLFDILDRLEKIHAHKKDALAYNDNGEWKIHSTAQYVEQARRVSFGLLTLNIKLGDKVATVTNNRPEWNFLDMGIAQVGAVHVPIYPTISDDQYVHILTHSEAKLLLVNGLELYNRLKPIADQIDSVVKVYTFDKLAGIPHWSELMELAPETSEEQLNKELVARKKSIHPHDLATIIYTSGTTGIPKGVMLSHWNFMFLVFEVARMIDLQPHAKALSFLPLCHVLERIGNYVFQYKGFGIYYAASIETVSEDIKTVSPEIMMTVPRLLEKVYDKILQKGKDLTGIKRMLFHWAVELGQQYEYEGKSFVYRNQLLLANKLIFNKWRAALGGKLKYVIVGGAALQPRLARVFTAAGIPVFEGYGLTETAPVIAVNRPGANNAKFGTVGPLIPDCKVRIAEDGEILFRGPNLMLGYYKDAALTAQTIDDEGWLHTGDIGEFEDDRFLKITDRKKEIFKTSGGKYVAPQVIENKLKESLFIDQLMVVGENKKFVGAIISPNFIFVKEWCMLHDINSEKVEELLAHPEVVARFQEEIDRLNKSFGRVQQIKRFRLVPDTWSPDTRELSPTLKLRRNFVKQKYAELLTSIYLE